MQPSDSNPLLSVVVPTLNRRARLQITLPLLIAQIAPHRDQVQLLVVDNCSEDDTEKYVGELREKYPFLEYRRYEVRSDIDTSFERCTENARGDYINIFGDDDIPLPGYVETLLGALKTADHYAFVYVNRLIGNEALNDVSELAHRASAFGQHVYATSRFIKDFTYWPGFITALTFSRSVWNEGNVPLADYSGYKFLARIYFGASNGKCLYVGAPLMIQRRGAQAWKSEWPRYSLVSMPSLLADLEKNDVTAGALVRWRDIEMSTLRIAVDCLVAKAYGYRTNDPFWRNAKAYQTPVRRWLIGLFQYCVPAVLAALIYFRLGKYRAK